MGAAGSDFTGGVDVVRKARVRLASGFGLACMDFGSAETSLEWRDVGRCPGVQQVAREGPGASRMDAGFCRVKIIGIACVNIGNRFGVIFPPWSFYPKLRG